MNNKAPLALIGQLLMVLFFALAAAICLQAFAQSEYISQSSADRDTAILYAQNAAETLKSTHGDLYKASLMLGGRVQKQTWMISYDRDWQIADHGDFQLTVTRASDTPEGLGAALVSVQNAKGTELFSMTCAWQEVLG